LFSFERHHRQSPAYYLFTFPGDRLQRIHQYDIEFIVGPVTSNTALPSYRISFNRSRGLLLEEIRYVSC